MTKKELVAEYVAGVREARRIQKRLRQLQEAVEIELGAGTYRHDNALLVVEHQGNGKFSTKVIEVPTEDYADE